MKPIWIFIYLFYRTYNVKREVKGLIIFGQQTSKKCCYFTRHQPDPIFHNPITQKQLRKMLKLD